MTPPARASLRRHAAELFTIIAGVLIALAADTLLDRRTERAREHAYLVGLREEFRASAKELEFDQRNRAAMLDRLEHILQAGHSGQDVPADSVPVWTVALVDFFFFSPPTAVLDDLFDSGSFGLIRSDSLRFEIQRYGQERSRLGVVEQRERDFVASQLEPFVARSLRMDDVLPLASYDHLPDLAPADPRAFVALLRDDTLASLAFMRWERTETAFRFAAGLGHAIQRVLDRLDEDLAGR